MIRKKNEERDDERRDGGRVESGRLDQPQEMRGRILPRMSTETFGVFAERFARYMGTAQFLVWMTIIVVAWVAWNLVAVKVLQFDPYPFILLNLFFSTQASYAAPLILLAQNRQDDREKVALEQDRARDERNLADTEFLTREVASLRLALRETATRDFVRSELRQLLDDMEERGMLAPESENDTVERRNKSEREKAEKDRARRERQEREKDREKSATRGRRSN